MKKILLFLLVLFIPVLILSDESQKPTPIKQEPKKPTIKYYKPDEKIGEYYITSGSHMRASEDKNYIVAIKAGDENHVKVVQRLNGVTYPELDFLRPFYASNFNLIRDSYYSHNYYIGRKNGKYGAIDKQGKILIPFVFDYNFNPATDNDIVFKDPLALPVVQGDYANHQPTFDYDYFYIYDNSQSSKIIVPKKVNDNRYTSYIYDFYKTGLADKEGKIIIPLEYAFLKLMNNKYICASVFKERLNSEFEINYNDSFRGDPYIKYINSGLFKDISSTLSERSEEDIIKDRTEKYLVRDIKKGVIDFNNNIIIPFEYSDINLVSQKYFVCEKDDKIGVLDLNNKVLVPFEYDELRIIDKQHIYAYKLNEELSNASKPAQKIFNVGILDYNNNIVIPFDYYILESIDDQHFYATGDNGKGIIDIHNNVVIPLEYGVLDIINDKYIYAEKGGASGIIDYKNNVIIPFDYVTVSRDGKGIYYVDDNFIVANENRKSYIIDINNNKLHEFRNRMKPFYYLAKTETNTQEEKLYSKDYVLSAHDGFLYDLNDNNYGIFFGIKPYGIITKKAGELNIIDNDKNVTVIKYGTDIVSDYPNALLISYGHNPSKYGLVDMKGNFIVKLEYDRIIYPTYVPPSKRNMEDSPKIFVGDKSGGYPSAEEVMAKVKEEQAKAKAKADAEPKTPDKYIAFSNKDNTVLVNLETLETEKYYKEVVGLDNEGNLYVREPAKDNPNAFVIVPINKGE